MPLDPTKPATKSEVYLHFNKFNEKTVRHEMKKAISLNRQVPMKEAGDAKVLTASEVAAVLKAFE